MRSTKTWKLISLGLGLTLPFIWMIYAGWSTYFQKEEVLRDHFFTNVVITEKVNKRNVPTIGFKYFDSLHRENSVSIEVFNSLSVNDTVKAFYNKNNLREVYYEKSSEIDLVTKRKSITLSTAVFSVLIVLTLFQTFRRVRKHLKNFSIDGDWKESRLE